jgi:tRNA-dihydrouridine synthase
MRRHYGSYFRGIHGFKEHRIKLVTEDNPDRVRELLNEVKEKYGSFEFA